MSVIIMSVGQDNCRCKWYIFIHVMTILSIHHLEKSFAQFIFDKIMSNIYIMHLYPKLAKNNLLLFYKKCLSIVSWILNAIIVEWLQNLKISLSEYFYRLETSRNIIILASCFQWMFKLLCMSVVSCVCFCVPWSM